MAQHFNAIVKVPTRSEDEKILNYLNSSEDAAHAESTWRHHGEDTCYRIYTDPNGIIHKKFGSETGYREQRAAGQRTEIPEFLFICSVDEFIEWHSGADTDSNFTPAEQSDLTEFLLS